jgi:peptidyl-prolyl cis-trans isomerase SurA
MTGFNHDLRSLARNAALAALTVAALWALAPPAIAQQIIARVNGEPITAVDVAQRTRLIQIGGGQGKAPSRQEVINELIDEQLKIQTARRYRMEITDTEVDQVLSTMASRMRANRSQFEKALSSAGVSINALKRKLKADLAWNNIVRGKFQATMTLREKDVDLAARERGKEGTSYLYTLRPVLFVIPRGARDGAIEARRKEAEALRNRFQGCEQGLQLARGLKDVAIRDPILRSSGDFSAKQREVIDQTQVGRLTPPDITPSGVEVFAVCEKKEGKGASGAERDVREQMLGERFNTQGQRYLKELRRSAAIEMK